MKGGKIGMESFGTHLFEGHFKETSIAQLAHTAGLKYISCGKLIEHANFERKKVL